MFSPPLVAALRKVFSAPSSIAFMSPCFCFFFFPLLTFARHIRHRESHSPSLRTRKWSLVRGNVWPQSMQILSLISRRFLENAMRTGTVSRPLRRGQK